MISTTYRKFGAAYPAATIDEGKIAEYAPPLERFEQATTAGVETYPVHRYE